MRKFRRGITVHDADYSHLKGVLDCEAFLEDLGIDIGFRQGKYQIMCHCPNGNNHTNGDVNPSFGFNEEKLAYNCFVCGGGNLLELVQMMNKSITTDDDALRYAEQFADFNREVDLQAKVKAILNPVEVKEETPDYPMNSLFQYRKIHPYLYQRGITKDVIVEMNVGFDEEHMGITIPHFWMGKLVGMQRRHLAMDEDGNYLCPRCDDKRIPKYKNTSRFPKINTLYGYDQMKEYVVRDGISSVIIVESPFSVLKLKSLGFNRVISTFGQFNMEQAMPLIAMERVYYWPDNDTAGRENVKKAIDSLARFVDLQIVPVLPFKKGDPGDLTTTEEVLEYLQAAYPASLFKLNGMANLADLQAKANT